MSDSFIDGDSSLKDKGLRYWSHSLLLNINYSHNFRVLSSAVYKAVCEDLIPPRKALLTSRFKLLKKDFIQFIPYAMTQPSSRHTDLCRNLTQFKYYDLPSIIILLHS